MCFWRMLYQRIRMGELAMEFSRLSSNEYYYCSIKTSSIVGGILIDLLYHDPNVSCHCLKNIFFQMLLFFISKLMYFL